MKTRILTILLALTVLFAVSGCGAAADVESKPAPPEVNKNRNAGKGD